MLKWLLSSVILALIITSGIVVYLTGAAISIVKFVLGVALAATIITVAALLSIGSRLLR
jgi:hypothetical protein